MSYKKYIFILGNNPELSVAEIQVVYPAIKVTAKTDIFLIGELADFDCAAALQTLGGTIKIGEVIGERIDEPAIIARIIAGKGASKVNFGFSFYGVKPSNVGLEIKKALKSQGVSSRLVTSRDRALSAVVVKKNKVLDFIVLPTAVGLTGAVQEFEAYGRRDYGRPKSDPHSGMLPPKLARMMINLAGVPKTATILDPFCGSGTVLAEAAALGYQNLSGSDLSAKAVADTQANLDWLKSELALTGEVKIFPADVRNLSRQLAAGSIDAIVTEPYLGPPIKGGESPKAIFKTIKELENLYLAAFAEFKKILAPGGKAVVVFPAWRLPTAYELNIDRQIAKLGFSRQNKTDLIYRRPQQKIWRVIKIWQT